VIVLPDAEDRTIVSSFI